MSKSLITLKQFKEVSGYSIEEIYYLISNNLLPLEVQDKGTMVDLDKSNIEELNDKLVNAYIQQQHNSDQKLNEEEAYLGERLDSFLNDVFEDAIELVKNWSQNKR